MAEGRFLSKSIATSGQLKRVSLEADYLFTRMIPHLDRDGRIDGDPDVVKAMACPLRAEITPELIATCLAELDSVGLIEWYEVDGQMIVWFPRFGEHQKGMHRERERASRFPDRSAQGAKAVRRTPAEIRTAPATPKEPSNQVKLSEVKSSEEKLRRKPSDSGESGRKAKSVPKYPHFPTDASDRLYQTCITAGHAVDMGFLRKTLAPLFPESPTFTLDELDAALVAFFEAREGQPPDKARFWTLVQFAQDASRWVRLGKMPRSDVNGVTERGRLALGIVA